jgi:hypothetical protein
VFFSLPLLILRALTPCTVLTLGQFTIGDKPQLLRYDYVAEADALRATEIIDVAHAGERRTASVTLLSAGEMRFVRMLEIDRDAFRHIEIIINAKGWQASFSRAPDSDLTAAERMRSVGVLTINGSSVKIRPKDAETATARLKVEAMLSAWDPTQRRALEILYKKTAACGLRVGKGALLPILFGDPPAGGCEPGMLEAQPDPKRDQEFVAIVPGLAEWLKTPATLMTKTSGLGVDSGRYCKIAHWTKPARRRHPTGVGRDGEFGGRSLGSILYSCIPCL